MFVGCGSDQEFGWITGVAQRLNVSRRRPAIGGVCLGHIS